MDDTTAHDTRMYMARMLARIGIPEITPDTLNTVIHRTHMWEIGVGHSPRPSHMVPSDYEGLIGLTALMPHEKTIKDFRDALIHAISLDADTWMAHNSEAISKLTAAPADAVAPELPHPFRATFEQIAAIDWSNVPVDGNNHQDACALAGRIRDFNEYYAPENTHLRSSIEGWLANHSAAHAYRPEN